MGDLVFLPGPLLTEDEYDSDCDSDGSDFSTASCCCSDCHDPREGWTGKASRWVLGCGGKRTRRRCPGDDQGCCGEERGSCCKEKRGGCRELCYYEEWHDCKGEQNGRDGRCRGASGGRSSRNACIQVNNTICYDCPRSSPDRDTRHRQRHGSCKCQKKKTSKRRWWSSKPAHKKPKARRRVKKRVTEYEYDYDGTNRRCLCGDDSGSEYETAEEEVRPRVIGRDRKVREERVRERVVEKPRRRRERRCAPRRVRRKPVRTPASGGESDDSLRCQVSDVDFGSETERGDAVAHYKYAVGWPRTPSRGDSDELGERGKGSRSPREFCRRSRHSI